MARHEIAVTIPVNGAEFMWLERACVKDGARSIPQYLRLRCGFPAALVTQAREPSGRPVRTALERRTVTMRLTPEEHAALTDRARLPRGGGLSLPQFIRTLLGFHVRHTSMPGSDQRVREEDDAWELLQSLGLNPQDYFEG
jgi:hypothetical protein